MADISFVLYDTAPMATGSNVEFLLFKVTQGGDATHTPNFTNMRGAGSLPTGEKMVVKKLSVSLDSASTVIADIVKIPVASYFEFVVNNQQVFICPLALLFTASAYSGVALMATNANNNALGLEGDGYELEIPVILNPGTSFYVRIWQGTALSAQTNLKVELQGIYTLPSSQ